MAELIDFTSVFRSKNAGPLWLTFDIMFKNKATYKKIKKSNAINRQKIANLYNVKKDKVSIIEYDIVNTIKVTIPRVYPSGDIRDTDIYGCQQHRPLAEIEIN